MRAAETASCLIFLVSVVIVSFAPAGEKWSFGFEGGWTYGSHWSTKEKTGDYSVATAAKSGFEIGAAATLKISRLFSLQSDVLYVRKGSNQVITVPGFPFGDIHVTYWLDYLEIPLLLRTYPFPEAKLKPSLVVGPYVAFQVNGQYAYRITFLGTTKEPIKDIKTTDYGVSFGAGLDLPGRGLMMRLDYRYTMGFVDLKLPTGPDFPQIALRNYCHSIMFGFFSRETAMLRMIEIISGSELGYSEAVKSGIQKLIEAGEKVHFFEVIEQRGAVREGHLKEFQVKIKVAVEEDRARP